MKAKYEQKNTVVEKKGRKVTSSTRAKTKAKYEQKDNVA